MVNKLLAAIGERYPLTEVSTGDYARLKANGMKFSVRAFQAENLGWVSVMTASGFFGLMKMDTLIVNPTAIDMPLLSYDRVHAMGNDTLIYELYDTMVEKTSLTATAAAKQDGSALPDHDLGSHWYDSIKLPVSLSKKGKKMHTVPFDVLTMNYMRAFLSDCSGAAACDADTKREKGSVYVEGLLTHGGPSTDVFKKAIGAEKTAQLFRCVLFGTKV
ncbi:MAG: hypothetical protein IKU68_01155 [Oscillospiraceae bacterium]|nr:hypothetical protein [Oscillospiraceae bacterium]